MNDVRTLLLQTVGGASVALGVLAAWRRLRLNEERSRFLADGRIVGNDAGIVVELRMVSTLGTGSDGTRDGGRRRPCR